MEEEADNMGRDDETDGIREHERVSFPENRGPSTVGNTKSCVQAVVD